MFSTPVHQVSTSACETVYDVNGILVKLWTITGGEPAIAFGDYSYMQRFPIKDIRWINNNWIIEERRYKHQDPNNIQGPTVNVLPNGVNTLINFVEKYHPLKKLKVERMKALPFMGNIRSKPYKDKESITFHCEACLDRYGVSQVQTISKHYKHIDPEKIAIAHPWWKKYSDFLLSISIKESIGYEQFSESQFSSLVTFLHEGLSSKAITKVTPE